LIKSPLYYDIILIANILFIIGNLPVKISSVVNLL